jgi:hypothetical protein
MGIEAERQGRLAVWEFTVEAAAAHGLAEAEGGGWTGGAGGIPVGGVLPLPVLSPRPSLRVGREARRVSTDVWLLVARAELADARGALLAASEQGLLVRLVQAPTDSVPQVVATSRPWSARPS